MPDNHAQPVQLLHHEVENKMIEKDNNITELSEKLKLLMDD